MALNSTHSLSSKHLETMFEIQLTILTAMHNHVHVVGTDRRSWQTMTIFQQVWQEHGRSTFIRTLTVREHLPQSNAYNATMWWF